MKNKLMVIALVIISGAMFSCKKDYTCSCTKTYAFTTGSASFADGSYMINDNKVHAASECNKKESTGSDILGSYSRQCDIK